MSNKIQEILQWWHQFDNTEIVIKTETNEFSVDISDTKLSHFLGMQYASTNRLKGRTLYNFIKEKKDEEIYDAIRLNFPHQIENVMNRVKYFKYFMEHLHKAILVNQTHENSKLHSSFLLVKQEDGTYLQLGIAHDRDDTDYFETFLVENSNKYFKNSNIHEKIISIEKWEQDKLVPFSFKSDLEQKKEKQQTSSAIEYITFLKNNILIQDYAEEELGFTIDSNSKGRQLSFVEHDSVVVYLEDNEYYRYATRKGGSIIDFIMEFKGCNFKQAVSYLGEYAKKKQIVFNHQQIIPKKIKPIIANGIDNSISLPEKDNNVKYIYSYLINQRCIKKEIVQKYIRRNLLYQDKHKNCIFIGYDEKNEIKYISVRSSYKTPGQKLHKWEVKNSDKLVGFYVENDKKSNTLVLCESCIDIMSIESINEKYEKYNYLQCGGVGKIKDCLDRYLNLYPSQFTNIILGLDNDEPGIDAKNEIKQWLQEHHPNLYVMEFTFNQKKDANEYICSLQESEELER